MTHDVHVPRRGRHCWNLAPVESLGLARRLSLGGLAARKLPPIGELYTPRRRAFPEHCQCPVEALVVTIRRCTVLRRNAYSLKTSVSYVRTEASDCRATLGRCIAVRPRSRRAPTVRARSFRLEVPCEPVACALLDFCTGCEICIHRKRQKLIPLQSFFLCVLAITVGSVEDKTLTQSRFLL